MRKLVLILLLIIPMLLMSQTPITVCNQLNSFTGMTRGYHFTAPTDFNICGLYVEDNVSTLFQSVAIVRFTAGAPPAWAGTTNSFVTLFQNLNYGPNNMIAVPNIGINTGDIIGIYGSRGANSINSYGNPNCVLIIGGFPTTARRSGMQADLATGPSMVNIWSEVNYNIGRVTMYVNCTLPIELLDFYGYNNNGINHIEWETTTEINNDFFTLERSRDSQIWKEITRQQGAGNSNTPITYEYKDDSYDDGTNYYRLTQTDFNGAYETFETISITTPNIKYLDYYTINLLGQVELNTYTAIRVVIWNDGVRKLVQAGKPTPKRVK